MAVLFQSLPEVFETKTDYLLGYARKNIIKNCGGHHGHIFDDGPNQPAKDIVTMVCV